MTFEERYVPIGNRIPKNRVPAILSLVKELYKQIPEHWKMLIPDCQVLVTSSGVLEDPDLRDEFKTNRRALGALVDTTPVVYVLIDDEDKNKDRIYVSGAPMLGLENRVSKEFLSAVAKLAALHSDLLMRSINSEIGKLPSLTGVKPVPFFQSEFANFVLSSFSRTVASSHSGLVEKLDSLLKVRMVYHKKPRSRRKK